MGSCMNLPVCDTLVREHECRLDNRWRVLYSFVISSNPTLLSTPGAAPAVSALEMLCLTHPPPARMQEAWNSSSVPRWLLAGLGLGLP